MRLCAALLACFVTAACGSTAQDVPDSGAAGEAGAAGELAAAGSPSLPEQGGAAGAADGGASGASEGGAPSVVAGALYASGIESFEPGQGAGHGRDALPGVVLGPPHGEGTSQGSLDVLSLGNGGEIVLGFGEHGIVDGAGPDFVVFENPFWPEGDPTRVFAELGEVSVSEDGKTWLSFDCDAEGDGDGHFPGCAGVTPTLEYDAEELVPLDPAKSGGDAFDLAELGVKRARFVRIRDLETLPPGGTSSGFDLDAVGVIYAD